MKMFRLTREVTMKECPWLPVDYPASTLFYEHTGPTYGCIQDTGTAVCEEPGGPFVEIPTNALKDEGEMPKAVPDPASCGAGRGAECCIFLALGGGREGKFSRFTCERYGSLHGFLLGRVPKMNAKRIPKEPWPDCMKFFGEPMP